MNTFIIICCYKLKHIFIEYFLDNKIVILLIFYIIVMYSKELILLIHFLNLNMNLNN